MESPTSTNGRTCRPNPSKAPITVNGTATAAANVPTSLLTFRVIREAYWPRNAQTPSTPTTKTATGHCSTAGAKAATAIARTTRSVPATISPLVRDAKRRRTPATGPDSDPGSPHRQLCTSLPIVTDDIPIAPRPSV